MEKETVYRISYSGNQIRCVRATEEYRDDEHDLLESYLAWFVVILGAVACYGWWRVWE